MKHAWTMAAAMMCAACSTDQDIRPVPPSEVPPTEPAKPGNASGTRLRKIERVGADGSREFVGWYDSERDEDCVFKTIEELRVPINKCLPKTQTNTVYADSACTIPVYPKYDSGDLGRSGNPLREYVLSSWQSETEDHVHIYIPSDNVYFEATGPGSSFEPYRMNRGSPCIIDGPVRTSIDYVTMREISIDDFVSWAEAVDGLGN